MRARVFAWRALRDHTPLTRRALRRAADEAELDARDRTLFARILGAEVRRRGALRALAEHFAGRKLRPDAAVFAHVGLAQLWFLDDVPDHAAISETIDAAREAMGERPAHALHGLLRRAQRETLRGTSGDPRRDVPLADIHFEKPVFADPDQHWLLWAEQAWNLPVAIARRWRNRLGDEATLRLAQASLLAPPSPRTNAITARALEMLGARAGENILETRPPPSADGTTRSEFDGALVAAPSTATGVLALRPAERWRFDAPRVASLAAVQTARLAGAAEHVRSGGRLVYTTHSIEPDENQRRVQAFLAAHADWKLDEEFALEPCTSDASTNQAVDGGYVARLVRDTTR